METRPTEQQAVAVMNQTDNFFGSKVATDYTWNNSYTLSFNPATTITERYDI